MKRVLIVDDEQAIRAALRGALAEEGYEVDEAPSAEAALTRLGELRPEVVVSDVRMPGMDGLELLRVIRERSPGTEVVLMTAYQEMTTVVGAMREGAAEFLVKPVDLEELLALLARLFSDRVLRRRAEPELETAPLLTDIVGRSPGMLLVFKRIGQAAATRASVLIRGESGTGKELVARAIHDNSTTSGEPFVAVNCAALPSGLLESELFGHVRGSFTGASSDRRGRFALAGQGTVFLDEIGDTTPEFQSKLLRVLQEREFHPVGAERAERMEARVIAATHAPLEAMIEEGRFRRDLYYRLRVVEITLPPLRERVQDLGDLARYLVRRASRALRCPEPVLSPAAVVAIERHLWPGNVRELENCLLRAVVAAGGSVVHPEHLDIARASAAPKPPLGALADVERAHIASVLTATGGNKTRAAEILRINAPRLNRLLRKYGLEETS